MAPRMELTVWSMLLTRPFLTPLVGIVPLPMMSECAIVGDLADEHDDLARPDVERHQDRFDLQLLPFLERLGGLAPARAPVRPRTTAPTLWAMRRRFAGRLLPLLLGLLAGLLVALGEGPAVVIRQRQPHPVQALLPGRERPAQALHLAGHDRGGWRDGV